VTKRQPPTPNDVSPFEAQDGLLPAPAGARRPRLIVLAGRGGTGKTLLVRWICERAFDAGRTVVIADGDRTNRTLPLYFDGVLAPPSADDPAVRRWVEAIINRMATERFDVVLDLGGGDMVLKHLAAELDLQAMLEEAGIDVTLLHLAGPEVESLGYLASVEAQGPHGAPLFAPARTAVVLNEGLVAEDLDSAEVFQPIRAHAVFRAALARGAEVVPMPRLKVAYEVNRRHLSFAAAAAGATADGLPPMTPTDRQRVKLWLRAMDAAFAGIAGWLP